MDPTLRAEVIKTLKYLLAAYASDAEQISREGGCGWNPSCLDADEEYQAGCATLAKLEAESAHEGSR